jgi:hypothetical protein
LGQGTWCVLVVLRWLEFGGICGKDREKKFTPILATQDRHDHWNATLPTKWPWVVATWERNSQPRMDLLRHQMGLLYIRNKDSSLSHF